VLNLADGFNVMGALLNAIAPPKYYPEPCCVDLPREKWITPEEPDEKTGEIPDGWEGCFTNQDEDEPETRYCYSFKLDRYDLHRIACGRTLTFFDGDVTIGPDDDVAECADVVNAGIN
jgi:hypothetical protein